MDLPITLNYKEVIMGLRERFKLEEQENEDLMRSAPSQFDAASESTDDFAIIDKVEKKSLKELQEESKEIS